jgi:hypothetical protein
MDEIPASIADAAETLRAVQLSIADAGAAGAFRSPIFLRDRRGIRGRIIASVAGKHDLTPRYVEECWTEYDRLEENLRAHLRVSPHIDD